MVCFLCPTLMYLFFNPFFCLHYLNFDAQAAEMAQKEYINPPLSGFLYCLVSIYLWFLFTFDYFVNSQKGRDVLENVQQNDY